ncbi:MAG: class II glutamine amidotransferase [Pseudomonadota bacterium]
MCRWLAYIGEPVTPEKYLYEEQFSLVAQSLRARKSVSIVNGDGFGLGWYGDKTEPGLFRDVLPAWRDENLSNLASQIKSPLFMAHVRAATDTPSNRTNCHPFRCQKTLFMHNGQIGGYLTVRREIEALISDEFYHYRNGTTDSEAIFLALMSLQKNDSFPQSIEKIISAVNAIMKKHDVREPFRMTAALSDGDSIHAVRYSSDEEPPTLFYEHSDGACLVVSEPLDNQLDQWQPVPKNHALEIRSSECEPVLTPLSHI